MRLSIADVLGEQRVNSAALKQRLNEEVEAIEQAEEAVQIMRDRIEKVLEALRWWTVRGEVARWAVSAAVPR